ncbi:MAG: phosphotransferase [Deltaproteobacteria bacterium]|nr:phosphotransferase [Deltaproteobacteria bacterium]
MNTDINLGRKIGDGATAEIFAYGENQVLKLLKANFSRMIITQDTHYSKIAHDHGLPVPKVWDHLEVDGRYGAIFDRIDGLTAAERLLKILLRPSKYAKMQAKLLASIHSIDFSGDEIHLPGSITQKGRFEEQIEKMDIWTEKKKTEVIEIMNHLPDGDSLCHGDFHGGNIIMSTNGPVIMDWDTGSQGNPWGDVAASSACILADPNPETAPNWHRVIHRMITKRINKVFLKTYLAIRPDTDNQLNKWLVCAYAARIGELSQIHHPAIPEKQIQMLSFIEKKLLSV